MSDSRPGHRPVASTGTLETLALVARQQGARPTVEKISVDPPGPGELRVRVLASGLCHTDLLVVHGRDWWPDYPYVLGHEGAGVVESTGTGVDPALEGQLVLLAWKSPCGRCRFCIVGRTWLCADPPGADGRLHLAGGDPLAPSLRVGSHAGYAVVPAAAAVPLPPLPPELACLLGCAVLTGAGAVRNTADVRAGQRVVVFGCGGVGLSVILGARVAGASTIVAVDPVPDRREAAYRAGATASLDPGDGDMIAAIRAATGGWGADHAFDAVGRSAVIETALACLDRGGICTLVGTPDVGDAAHVDLELLYLSRLSLRVSQYGDAIPARDAPALAAQHLRGDIDVGILLSQRISVEDAPSALEALRSGQHIRSVITFDGA